MELLSPAEAVPAGGSIDWVTYYFRDRRLAAALVEAHGRGVDVRVTLDGHPRTPHGPKCSICGTPPTRHQTPPRFVTGRR